MVVENPCQTTTPVGMLMTKQCTKCGEVKPKSEFYSPGATCKRCYSLARGHVPKIKETLPDGMKRCSMCKKVKPFSAFHSHKGHKDGMNSACRTCICTYQRKKYTENPEYYHKKNNEYFFTHREENARQCKAYYEVHKEELCRYQKEWRTQNYHLAWARDTLKGHKSRGFDVGYSTDDLALLAIKTTHCPICGQKLSFNKKEGRLISSSPSLDRIFNEKSITPKNTWIICYRCNSMKRDMPLPELVEWCRKVISKFEGASR